MDQTAHHAPRHFHEETWSFDDGAGVWNLQNIVVQVPFPKGAW